MNQEPLSAYTLAQSFETGIRNYLQVGSPVIVTVTVVQPQTELLLALAGSTHEPHPLNQVLELALAGSAVVPGSAQEPQVVVGSAE